MHMRVSGIRVRVLIKKLELIVKLTHHNLTLYNTWRSRYGGADHGQVHTYFIVCSCDSIHSIVQIMHGLYSAQRDPFPILY